MSNLILTRSPGEERPEWVREHPAAFDLEDYGWGCSECPELAETLLERGTEPGTREPFYWAVCESCETECKVDDQAARAEDL